MNVRRLASSLALLAAAGCSEPLLFADWTLPVAEGTPVVEYEYVPIDRRGGDSIEWVEELVIGDRGDADIRYAFGRPTDVTVDSLGQIYVVDAQAVSVKVFDADGEYLRVLGGEGQGPGEFQSPRSVVAVDGAVIVGASRNARWSHFDLQGNHLHDYAYPIFDNLELVLAMESGDLVGSTTGFSEGERVNYGYGIYSPKAELVRTIVEMSFVQVPTIQRGTLRSYFSRTPFAVPQAAVSNDGGAYWSMSGEYQILAVGADGAQRWALRVASTPPAVSREQIDDVMTMVRNRYEDATESEVNFPDRQPALGRLQVDGHGHLYVFSYLYVPLDEARSTAVPLDVYAADGERLFSGMALPRTWVHASGDHVWEIGPDPTTEEFVVRKIRLVEPFD